MKSVLQFSLGVALCALCACGGGAKDADTTPAEPELEATPVAAEGEAAAPANGETSAGDEPAAAAESADAPVCDRLCGAVLTCAKEMSDKEPSEDEAQQFLGQCAAKCAEEPPERLELAGACVDENQGNCAGLFPCFEKIESAGDSE